MPPIKSIASSGSNSTSLTNEVQAASLMERRHSRATSTSATNSLRRRTRTAKACDRCRFKKSKCDGRQPCKRCAKDDSPCLYSSRVHMGRKPSMFETISRMSEGLQVMYQAFQEGKPFPGHFSPSGHDKKEVSAHEILERLGLIRVLDEDDARSSTSGPNSPRDPLSLQEVDEQLDSSHHNDVQPNSPGQVDVLQDPDWATTSCRTSSGDAFNLQNLFPQTTDEWVHNSMMMGLMDDSTLFQPLPQYPGHRQDTFFQSPNDFQLQTVP